MVKKTVLTIWYLQKNYCVSVLLQPEALQATCAYLQLRIVRNMRSYNIT